MGINLSKGEKWNLTKESPGIKKLMVGLGWRENAFEGATFDLDASAFLLGENGKCKYETDFIFYKNLEHASGGVKHMGDDLVGGGDGDNEQILVELDKLPKEVTRIAFTVTIYNAEQRRQNFGQVSDAFIRIVDNDANSELVRYDLTEDFSVETAIVAGELYKKDNEWKFNAIGNGFSGGLAALCGHYGIDVE